jgi:hypothetical protein
VKKNFVLHALTLVIGFMAFGCESIVITESANYSKDCLGGCTSIKLESYYCSKYDFPGPEILNTANQEHSRACIQFNMVFSGLQEGYNNCLWIDDKYRPTQPSPPICTHAYTSYTTGQYEDFIQQYSHIGQDDRARIIIYGQGWDENISKIPNGQIDCGFSGNIVITGVGPRGYAVVLVDDCHKFACLYHETWQALKHTLIYTAVHELGHIGLFAILPDDGHTSHGTEGCKTCCVMWQTKDRASSCNLDIHFCDKHIDDLYNYRNNNLNYIKAMYED